MRALFDSTGVELEFERELNPFLGFRSADDWVEFMATNYGPLLAAREKLAADGRWEQLREELVEVTASLDTSGGGELRVASEYLVTLARVGGR